jgi:hypothetical protein
MRLDPDVELLSHCQSALCIQLYILIHTRGLLHL